MSTVAKSVLLSSAIMFTVASAEANVARHERVKINEIKKDGKVVGMKINLTLRPQGYERARIGIAPAGKKPKDHRAAASDASTGHLHHQFKEVKFDKQEPKKMELKLMYKDAKGLEPGADIEIVSAFNKSSNKSYWHVYGITGVPGATPDKYKAPGKKAAAKRRTGITEIRRSGKKNRTARRKATQQRRRTRARANNVRRQRKQVRKQVRKGKPKARARR